MTIDEAREIQNSHFDQDTIINDNDYRDATNLSIEAFDYIKDLRSEVLFDHIKLLPGETEE